MSLVSAESLPFERRQALLPLMIITFGGALTGFSGVFVRFSETGALATGAWRMTLASLALLPFLHLARGSGGDGTIRPFSPILILAGLFFAVDMAFYNWSLGYTSIAQSTLIVNLAPIVALAAGFLMFGERFGPAKAAALIAAVGGAALMTASRWDQGGTLFGNGLAMLGMFGYAFYLVVVKHARGGHGTLAIMFGSSATAGAIMFAGAVLAGEQILPVTAAGWSVLIALGLVSHIFGQGLIAFGMRDAPVGLASILLLSQPIVAALAAWAVFDEIMGPVEIGGAAMILAGLAIASRSRS